MKEDPEIYLPKEEALKLPILVKLALVNRFPEEWRIIRKATLQLLTTGKSPTYAELEGYARQIWRKPYTPWFLLKTRWKKAGINTEIVIQNKNGMDVYYYELKGIRLKESVLKALMKKAKSTNP